MSIGTRIAKGHRRLPERLSPKLPHSRLRLPRGVTTRVMTAIVVIGIIALSRTPMPAWGRAMAMAMASENAIPR